MSIAVAVLTLMLLAAVMAVVSRPLLSARKPANPRQPERQELEAEREAKYREIRDAGARLPHRQALPRGLRGGQRCLRAEAVEILNKLESSESDAGAGEKQAAGEKSISRVSSAAGSCSTRT